MDARRRWTVLVWLVLALADGPVAAATRDPDVPDSAYVAFGKKFPFVVPIVSLVDPQVRTAPNGAQLARPGSAVIIRPHWVLTVAHNVESTVKQTVIQDNETVHPLTYLSIHAKYQKTVYGEYDIALGYSPQDFQLDFYVPLYIARDEQHKAVTFAGFGKTGTFVTGVPEDAELDGKRRAGSNIISLVGPQCLFCDASKHNKTALELLIAPGDSGGGLFIGNSLAGLASFVAAPKGEKADSDYGDLAAFARVSTHVDWIESEIQKYEATLPAKNIRAQ